MDICQRAKNLWMRFAHTLGRVNTMIILNRLLRRRGRTVYDMCPTCRDDEARSRRMEKKEPLEPTIDWASHQF